MKKHAKKMPPKAMPMRRAMPATIPEGSPMDREMAAMPEGSSAEERYDERQAARKSRPRVV